MKPTKSERTNKRIYDHLAKHGRSLSMEYELILEKKSTLSSSERQYIMDLYEKENEQTTE